ncbi:MAG: YdcF family protein [Firmicutes bacterium]|nr:YdcF family protein [Bacillota bacterium]
MRAKRPFFKKWRFCLCLIVTGCTLFGAFLLTSVIINAKRLNAPEPADVMTILGAQVYADGVPSPWLASRLELALTLYAKGYAGKIITTGAQGSDEPMPEAEMMKAYLVANGVPREAVYCDPASYDTIQNITNAKAIMDARGLRTAIVVTSDYHLWRALSICKGLGLPATGAGARST